MMDNKDLVLLAGKGGGGGSVTPASIVSATGNMTAEQKAQTRANIGATDAQTSIPDNVKTALLNCFNHVAWDGGNLGQSYIDALESALYPLDHITAVYTQSRTVYDTDSLDSLKTDLAVTAVYEGGSTETIDAADYTLSGTLTVGTSTITVTYMAKTATFDVVVTEDQGRLPPEYQEVEWIEAHNGPVIDTNNPLTENSEIRARMRVMGTGSATGGSYSALFGRTTPSIIAMHNSAGVVGLNFARASSLLNVASLGLSDPHDLTLNKTECLVDGVVKGTFTGDMTAITEQRNLLIFAWNDTNSPYGPTKQGYARCYSFQIYDNGDLVNDLVPCYRKSDNEIGMYDLVQQAFRTNVGTGSFTKGSDV